MALSNYYKTTLAEYSKFSLEEKLLFWRDIPNTEPGVPADWPIRDVCQEALEEILMLRDRLAIHENK